MMIFSSFCVSMEKLSILNLYRHGLSFLNFNLLLSGCKFHSMCVSPVKILNPKLAWTPNDPKYLLVECGRCFECRARKQQEWFVRSYYEFKSCKGSSFFFTLTFDNEHLPIYEDVRDFQYIYRNGERQMIDKPVNYRFSCFDSDLLTTFMKLFRQNCKRKFKGVDTTKIKFFLACEYGEKTHRPHLHGDIYCPFKMSERDFREIITRSWTNGFVGSSRKGGFSIRSISALEYTSKYSCKDLYFYDNVLNNYLDKDSLSLAEYEYRYDSVKKHLPRLRVSQGFGSALKQEILDSNDCIDMLLSHRPLQLPKKNGQLRNFLIPRYIVNSLVKRIDRFYSQMLKRPYFVLTPLGKEYKLRILQSKIEDDIQGIYSLRNILSLDSSKRSDYDTWFFNRVKKTFDSMIDFLSPEKISVYRNYFRFLPVDSYGKHSADWYFRRFQDIQKDLVKDTIPDELFMSLRDYWNSCQYSPSDVGVDIDFSVGTPLDSPDNVMTLSQLGEFRLYEQISKVLDDYHSWFVRKRSRRCERDSDRRDLVRATLVDFCLYNSDGLVRQVV